MALDENKVMESLSAIEKASTESAAKVPALEKKVEDLTQELIRMKSVQFIPGQNGVPRAKNLKERQEFLKGFLNSDPAFRKSINETAGTSTGQLGYFIPQEWADDVIFIMYEYGKIRSAANIIPMNRQILNYPELASGASAGWITAGSTITSGAPSAISHVLTAKKLAALTIYDNEFLADATPPIVDAISRDAGMKLAQAEQYAALSGSGASDYTNGGITGILNSTTVNTVTATAGVTGFSAALTVENLSSMIDAIPYNTLENPVFVFDKSFRPYIRTLKDTLGYIWRPSIGGDVETLWGFPIIWTVNAMPTITQSATGTAFAIFGDMKQGLHIGQRQEIEVALSRDNLFQNDQTVVKWTIREDMFVVGKVFSVLKTANS